MAKLSLLSLITASIIGLSLTSRAFLPSVDLQPSSPGVQQSGHINISGRLLSGGISVAGDTGVVAAVTSNAPSGSTYGGVFKVASPVGRAIRGYATAATGSGIGGDFQTDSPSGIAVKGLATASSGNSSAIYGQSLSADGFAGTFLGRVYSSGNFGLGTKSPAAKLHVVGNGLITGALAAGSLAGSGTGITDLSASSIVQRTLADQRLSTNVPLKSSENTFTKPIVVAVASDSLSQTALDVTATGGYADISYGGRFHAQGGIFGYGVYADVAQGAQLAYAGYFNGPLYATSAYGGIKSFLIDHPLDPANKYLEHSSVESDERLNLYRGDVLTDARGYATVTVPPWFSALNEDVQYQLTVIDVADSEVFPLVKLVRPLVNGKFRLRSSTPHARVQWLVSGRRCDPTSDYYPLTVERDKGPYERGRYLAPEAFGIDRSRSMGRVGMSWRRADSADPMAVRGPGQRR